MKTARARAGEKTVLVPEPPAAERRVFTVSELLHRAKQSLELEFARVWVEGEISNFKLIASGHAYPTLKDDQSVLSLAIFRPVLAALPFELGNGMKVLVGGTLSIYEPQGRFQLIVEHVEPRGAGALALAFEQLKQKLAREGLFDPAAKKPLPFLPGVIGVVTSPAGAAIRDILNVVSRRFAAVHLLLYPVRVQGEGAAGEIAEAIRWFNAEAAADVLIVGRGGGSLEELWAFNEEVVARAIGASRIPVVSAVGHEVDWTISDFVADLRAPTPSAAAELVIPRQEDLAHSVSTLGGRLVRSVRERVADLRERLGQILASYAFRRPQERLLEAMERLDELAGEIERALALRLDAARATLEAGSGKLEALSPLAILARGYSVTFSSAGRALKDADEVRKGDRLRTRLFRGDVTSEVL